MTWYGFALLALALLLLGVAPGFAFVRRLHWNPVEKFTAAIGLSLFLLYLVAFAIFCVDLPRRWQLPAYLAGTLILLAIALPGLGDFVQLLRARELRRHLLAYAMLLVWTLLLLSLVRHYGGGTWAGDWIDQYQRTLFWMRRPFTRSPDEFFRFLPVRPPMMNLVAGLFMAQAGDGFDGFQLVYLALNTLVFFPCCLIARALAPRGGAGRRTPFLVAALLMLNPMFVQNVTWTWTKVFAAFYIIFGIWLYLRAWNKNDPVRFVCAFAAITMGMLVHYSAGPYALFLGLHFVGRFVVRRPFRWRELGTSIAICALMLATWWGWSIKNLGVKPTFASNTTVGDFDPTRMTLTSSTSTPAQTLARVSLNVVDSFIPHALHVSFDAFRDYFQQESLWGFRRDYLFMIYQTNVIFAMGSVGGIVVLYLLWKLLRRPSPRRWFWIGFLVFCTLVGIAAHGPREYFGLANISQQPMILMGIALLAGSLPRLARQVRWLGVIGAAADFLLGIFLHFRLENRVFDEPGPSLSRRSFNNWLAKQQESLTYFGDHFPPALTTAIQLVLLAAAAYLLARLVTVASRAIRPAGKEFRTAEVSH